MISLIISAHPQRKYFADQVSRLGILLTYLHLLQEAWDTRNYPGARILLLLFKNGFILNL